MKTWILVVYLVAVFALSACAVTRPPVGELEFFYTSKSMEYKPGSMVFTPEARDVAGDLSHKLSVYLQGPQSGNLVSPFPDGVALQQLHREDDKLTVVLSQEFSNLTGIELSLACGCLAKTCFSLSDAAEVEIRVENADLDGAASITITPDTLLLADNSKTKQGGGI